MKSSVWSAPLAGKRLVVIGGTAGLGLSAVKAFVAAGARVLAVGLKSANVENAQREVGADATIVCGDALCPDTAVSALSKAVSAFGGVDGLYHVAGGSGRPWGDGPLHEISDEGWDATFKLNLTSLFYSNRAAVRQFLAQGTGGTILNMGSVLGFSPSPAFFATHAYATAKSAVVGFTKSCAAFYASQGIRFNVLAPGLVETPMAQRAVNDETILAFIKSKQTLDGGRIGQPADLDAAAVYFMSDASKFTTGQVLAVDGAWSVTEGQLPVKP
ncbi:MAG TPA: SDR family oxidoreductase [Verrucomicrobiae bacterium]|jgi:NAD(P)-dependent dehydrogenase (short-subunit alcohol dehydrogenase family)|nr:SDR family oxidoreductase [Verrucomicrobiae bacterium]